MRLSAAEVARLVERARVEVIPTAGVATAVRAHVPVGVPVTVTASPTKGLEATVSLAEQLAGEGYAVVPHLSARMVASQSHLEELVGRLVRSGVTDVFVPAGDAPAPAGHFEGALPLLEALDALGRPFAEVGITGYPEPHPHIHDDVTIQSMWDKRRHATYIVSNLCLDPGVLRRWVQRLRVRGIELPLYVGVAGPVTTAKLLSVASKIGVGESGRFLRSHSASLFRIGAPGAYDPGRLLARVGTVLTDEASRVAGLHVFSFNQLEAFAQWRGRLVGALAPSE